MGCVRVGAGVNDNGVHVAGFETFELFHRDAKLTAGGVEAVLQAGERLVALLQMIWSRRHRASGEASGIVSALISASSSWFSQLRTGVSAKIPERRLALTMRVLPSG